MTLSRSTRFGPHEFLVPLGPREMGGCRAEGSRLAKDVAAAVLPEPVDADPNGLARFQRDATAVVQSAFNTPRDHAVDEGAVLASEVSGRISTSPARPGLAETFTLAAVIAEEAIEWRR